MAEPRVFVAHEAVRPFDLSAAERYGQIAYVIPKSITSTSNPEALVAQALDAFKSPAFSADRDYFLTAGGDPLVNVAVTMALKGFLESQAVCEKSTHINLLRFNRGIHGGSDNYSPVRLKLQ